MPEFKERPKTHRPKTRPTAVPSKQAAHKYRQQLNQRPEGADSETSYATDQVEGAGCWTACGVPRRERSKISKNAPQVEAHFFLKAVVIPTEAAHPISIRFVKKTQLLRQGEAALLLVYRRRYTPF